MAISDCYVELEKDFFLGPVTLDTLVQYAADGQIDAKTTVRIESLGKTVRAGQIKKLKGKFREAHELIQVIDRHAQEKQDPYAETDQYGEPIEEDKPKYQVSDHSLSDVRRWFWLAPICCTVLALIVWGLVYLFQPTWEELAGSKSTLTLSASRGVLLVKEKIRDRYQKMYGAERIIDQEEQPESSVYLGNHRYEVQGSVLMGLRDAEVVSRVSDIQFSYKGVIVQSDYAEWKIESIKLKTHGR